MATQKGAPSPWLCSRTARLRHLQKQKLVLVREKVCLPLQKCRHHLRCLRHHSPCRTTSRLFPQAEDQYQARAAQSVSWNSRFETPRPTYSSKRFPCEFESPRSRVFMNLRKPVNYVATGEGLQNLGWILNGSLRPKPHLFIQQILRAFDGLLCPEFDIIRHSLVEVIVAYSCFML